MDKAKNTKAPKQECKPKPTEVKEVVQEWIEKVSELLQLIQQAMVNQSKDGAEMLLHELVSSLLNLAQNDLKGDQFERQDRDKTIEDQDKKYFILEKEKKELERALELEQNKNAELEKQIKEMQEVLLKKD